ncbi:MAG: tRNA uridine-5-carboxymethylaminomethyl(34) synthesis GTPase MnmE, partial [Methylophilaceae bacterium]|nr:tRNA uridine-5-carboxymethylaminomethyl(34) synthesis GTPase MnmE [Methylophilaceae bacterium]
PGEFTRRAYLNDKLDLAQAEAVADVINAATTEAAKSAVRSLTGAFSDVVNQLLAELINLRLYVEACLDFPEEEIDFITQGRVAEKISNNQQVLENIFSKAQQGVLLRDGIHVVLIGQPNVGKSSLMNVLSGEEVAIVTPIAGTTRDTIKSEIQINGVPLHVIDTAGLRDTEDEVEKIGIARTYRATETAHIALILIDAAHGIGDKEKAILARLPHEITKIWVHNKIDVSLEEPRVEVMEGSVHLFLSAKTGLGLDLLKTYLLSLVGYQQNTEGVFMARARHLDALKKVRQHLVNACSQINMAELLAEELRLAQEALSSITGEFTPDDLLGEIFSRFCIGK